MPRFRCRRSFFRCVSSGLHMFVFSSLTWPADSEPSTQSLPTPALDRHDTAVVWDLRLHGEPGGPASITGTARFVLSIFYIGLTFLQGHPPPSNPGRFNSTDGRRSASFRGAGHHLADGPFNETWGILCSHRLD